MGIPCAIDAENNSVILLFRSWTLDVGRWTLDVFLILKRVPSVDLRQHGFHFWIAQFVFRVPPVKRAQRFIERIVRLLRLRNETQSELMHEPRVGSSIAGRINRFLAPLQKPLRVCERACLFRVPSRWKKENFRVDFFRLQFVALNLGRITPERSRFDFDHLANDQPFQFRQRRSLEPGVCRSNRWVLAHHEHAFHFSVGHVVEVFEEGMVSGDLRDPVVAKIIFDRCVLAVVRFQQADEYAGRLCQRPVGFV